VCAIFDYGMRRSTHVLPDNPVVHADRRAEPEPAVLAFYTPAQVESLASALARGAHRDATRAERSAEEQAARAEEDRQDGEIIRLAAFTGLRRGELVALRWRDIDFHRRTVTVQRSLSGSEEANSTKSRRARHVPMPNQAKAALERLLARADFTSPDDYVFVNRYRRRIDPSALRRRYERARDAEHLEPLRFHDLRHTYGSLLVGAGVDLVSVKAAMGHWGSRQPSATCTLDRRRRWRASSRPRSRHSPNFCKQEVTGSNPVGSTRERTVNRDLLTDAGWVSLRFVRPGQRRRPTIRARWRLQAPAADRGVARCREGVAQPFLLWAGLGWVWRGFSRVSSAGRVLGSCCGELVAVELGEVVAAPG
jgi:site-specific recombinase XerD